MNFLIQLKRNAILQYCGTAFSYQVKAQSNFGKKNSEISEHNANTAIFAILGKKEVNNLQKKTDIYQNYDRNGTKLRSMYRIALLNEKIFENAAQLKRNKFEGL